MLVQWQKDFEVGNAVTDAEHRDVVDLLNTLDADLTAGSPPETIDRTLMDLAQVLTLHLHAEHEAVEQVLSLRNALRGGGGPRRGDLRPLARWWLSHLCGQECPLPRSRSH